MTATIAFARARRVLLLVVLVATCGAVAGPARADDTSASGGMSADPLQTGLAVTAGDPIAGRTITLGGILVGAPAGAPVSVQRLETAGRWSTLASATAGSGGRYSATWTADHAGVQMLRAVAGEGTGAISTTVLTVYRRARATFFGPGLYGERTACGQKLTHRLLGVANKSLPCGTLVGVYFHGHSATVPVVDRGPFRPGTRWDLTSATATALGFTSTAPIGAVSIPSQEAPRVGRGVH